MGKFRVFRNDARLAKTDAIAPGGVDHVFMLLINLYVFSRRFNMRTDTLPSRGAVHELLSACVLAVFFFLYIFFVHLCICIISLSCKGGQR